MTTPRTSDLQIAIALLVMRVTLGVFLLQWSVEKLVVPSSMVHIYAHFYGIALPPAVPPFVGLAEIAFSIALIAGLWRRPVYGLAILVHGISTLAIWRQLLDPFGLAKVGGHLYIAAVPALGALIALYLLRDLDVLSLDGWRAMRRNGKALGALTRGPH